MKINKNNSYCGSSMRFAQHWIDLDICGINKINPIAHCQSLIRINYSTIIIFMIILKFKNNEINKIGVVFGDVLVSELSESDT